MFFQKCATGLAAGACAAAFSVSFASSGYAQSALTSDSEYLSAVESMATEMDLSGLAVQTFEPTSVTAPQLPKAGVFLAAVSCESLEGQAKELGQSFEIISVGATPSSNEYAVLSSCTQQATGVLVSFAMSGS